MNMKRKIINGILNRPSWITFQLAVGCWNRNRLHLYDCMKSLVVERPSSPHNGINTSIKLTQLCQITQDYYILFADQSLKNSEMVLITLCKQTNNTLVKKVHRFLYLVSVFVITHQDWLVLLTSYSIIKL